MHPNHVIDRFEQVLSEERRAIQQVDTQLVVDLASEKEALMRTLATDAGTADDAFQARLAALITRMRENLVLLVHAKACIQDVVQSLTAAPATYAASGQVRGASTGAQVSITG